MSHRRGPSRNSASRTTFARSNTHTGNGRFALSKRNILFWNVGIIGRECAPSVIPFYPGFRSDCVSSFYGIIFQPFRPKTHASKIGPPIFRVYLIPNGYVPSILFTSAALCIGQIRSPAFRNYSIITSPPLTHNFHAFRDGGKPLAPLHGFVGKKANLLSRETPQLLIVGRHKKLAANVIRIPFRQHGEHEAESLLKVLFTTGRKVR